mmetsp:Transcript_15641/g.36049  ORF Transcript_15641/g.36049 Transcript_15641/m.36049 type:complete len:341 (+) Transcript_15641:64-1086(+)|eukprot:CAMPEP_0114146286 /NCGR_PEP_ID=MMETSP0043_2-20121206/20484_1 /TAXON_ID=464988 /ORGANISM="Hemiselmis andersenii, Strain CCMP644" /LENGTH=340 /DNA_ID=CAMNT_0001240731 /DNA_START=49 /DNA_END=1071 /DNA_ORIENTATION=-
MGLAFSAPIDVKSKLYSKFVDELPDLSGKVYVITGTTSGTGNAAARACAKKGGNVVMLNRKSERSDKALADIKAEFPGALVQHIDCDLMDLASVRKAADRVKGLFSASGIDCLSLNAGVMALEDKATQDGYDVQIQTNHISGWLLAAELMPLLTKAAKRTGEARVVTHSSGMRNIPPNKLEAKYFEKNGGDLGGNDSGYLLGGGRWQRYHQTKLANAVMTYALADKLSDKGSKVISASCEPGYSATNLQVTTYADGGIPTHLPFRWIGFLLAQSAEDGSLPLLSAMCGKSTVNGDFYVPKWGAFGAPVKLPKREKLCDDEESKRMLWEKSVLATGKDIAL